jgi:hypothetical protein
MIWPDRERVGIGVGRSGEQLGEPDQHRLANENIEQEHGVAGHRRTLGAGRAVAATVVVVRRAVASVVVATVAVRVGRTASTATTCAAADPAAAEDGKAGAVVVDRSRDRQRRPATADPGHERHHEIVDLENRHRTETRAQRERALLRVRNVRARRLGGLFFLGGLLVVDVDPGRSRRRVPGVGGRADRDGCRFVGPQRRLTVEHVLDQHEGVGEHQPDDHHGDGARLALLARLVLVPGDVLCAQQDRRGSRAHGEKPRWLNVSRSATRTGDGGSRRSDGRRHDARARADLALDDLVLRSERGEASALYDTDKIARGE